MKKKPVYGLLLLVFLLSFRISFGQGENNSVLDKKVTIEVLQESIASILDKISIQSQVFFSYDVSLIEANKITDLSITDRTIREVLDVLFDSRFNYKVFGEQIIIAKHEDVGIQEDTCKIDQNPKILIFKGMVLDLEEKVVLPYTSISVLKTNIGTISNIDGKFELKIPESMNQDTIVFSFLGYRQLMKPISEIMDTSFIIYLQPTSVQLKEIKIEGVNPDDIINKILSKIYLNFSLDPEIMTSFYREVLKQDDEYIDVSEALMEIRKAPYDNKFAEDKVKIIRGRKNVNVKPFKYVDFKIQGGPYYITKLDVVKTLDSFLDPEFRDFYKYTLDGIVEFDDREAYVIRFKTKEKVDYPCYQGKLFVDISTFALVKAEFSLNRAGLKFARESLIRKKPKDFYVRPLSAEYMVSYRRSYGKWHLNNAQASINFRVKSKNEKINSTFYSISDLVITDIKPDDGTHYKRNEMFNPKEIFSEMISGYDESFWGDYNIIRPSEDLLKALENYYQKSDTLFKINEINTVIPNNK